MLSDKASVENSVKLMTVSLGVSKSCGARLISNSDIGYYLTFLMLHLGEGHAFAFFLDRNRRLIKTLRLKKDKKPTDATVLESISSVLSSEGRCRYFFIAHNHKNKPLIPSPEDIITTDTVSETYRDSSVKFLGHFITSGLDYVCLTEGARIKDFI